MINLKELTAEQERALLKRAEELWRNGFDTKDIADELDLYRIDACHLVAQFITDEEVAEIMDEWDRLNREEL